MIEESY